ncbi:hypothetical protein UFOVP1090_28 [uncultured Caudovirales phage]|uniref:Uncharacterized protein n=1 Tax=uncultured Caudovirales phage TaxID=2100421 RepID=A0A6J5QD75_9CAUD|nr:hypothetical protein UFOVP1090_28 [uncultured Caudovirales phage]
MGLETVALIAIVTAGTIGAVGSIQAANAAEKQGEAARNAANVEAVTASQQAASEASRVRDRNKRIAASQRVSFLKSGLTLDGTEDVIYDSAIQGELDALNVTYRGDVAATGSRTRGSLANAAAKSQATAYRYQAVGSVLGAAGSAASVGSRSSQPTFSGTSYTG